MALDDEDKKKRRGDSAEGEETEVSPETAEGALPEEDEEDDPLMATPEAEDTYE